MPRTNYNNGDEITLTKCGCDGCEILAINGLVCHETGCPESWRDTMMECLVCGYECYRTEKHQALCKDCQFDEMDDEDMDDDEDDDTDDMEYDDTLDEDEE